MSVLLPVEHLFDTIDLRDESPGSRCTVGYYGRHDHGNLSGTPRPDRITSARLYGAAHRHATKRTPEDVAVAELRELAGGRADLLGQEAGVFLGSIGRSGHPPWEVRAMELLIAAGADIAVIPAVAAETAARLRTEYLAQIERLQGPS